MAATITELSLMATPGARHLLLYPFGSVLSFDQSYSPSLARVTVETDLTDTYPIYYHWYLDGQWITTTTAPELVIFCNDESDQQEIDCVPTYHESFDPLSVPQAAYPARRVIEWTASPDSDIEGYRVQYATGAGSPADGDWITLAVVPNDGQFRRSVLSQRLDDLTWYWFRVQAIDAASNVGTALTLGPEYVVRRPDAPEFDTSFDDGTQRVTFT